MTDVFTHGSGPFITPLCTKFVALGDGPESDAVVLELQLEDGAKLLIPIHRSIVRTLSQVLAVADLRLGDKAGTKRQ